MRKSLALFIIAAALAVAVSAYADLQNVQVGGSVRLRGEYWTSPVGPDKGMGVDPLAGLRWPKQPGRLAIVSGVGWNKDNNGIGFVEQRTKLHVAADFTEQVNAFVEFDSYDIWGEDFRSNYLTGVDSRANSLNDVEIYQAYIEANEMFGVPLRLRVGRQEMKFGSGWLIGTNDAGSFFTGLSFDAVRATYATDKFSVDAFWAKLADNSPLEEDGDVDLYGVYATCKAVENVAFDVYWLMVRDARSIHDAQQGPIGEWLERVAGVDNYGVTNLHTVGMRAAGKYEALDFDAEVAYQFGNAGAVGHQFAGAGVISPYGDSKPSFDNWAANVMLGYSFDVDLKPHVFAGGAYLGGEDNRALSFGEWLGAVANPFWHPKASVSFNRLFSDWQYGQFVGSQSHDCTNLWVAYAGLSVAPTDCLTIILSGAHVESLADYKTTWPIWHVFGKRITPLYPLSWIDQTTDSLLCWELNLTGVYRYSADLSFEAGYAHLFLGDGAAAGNFNLGNGLMFEGGTAHDDPDYFYFETKLSF